jgi:molecular chaperone DnaK
MNFDVTFDIDANGILSVHARDTKTGKEKEIKVDTRNLEKEKILKMIEDAEGHKESDSLRRTVIDC